MTSVIIIGGGIIGIACAHYLSEAGFSVTVVEAGTVAGACSQGNCGYICPSHALPLAAPEALREGISSLFNPAAAFRIKPRLDPAFANWMWQFARRCSKRTMLENGHHLSAILKSSMSEYARLLDDNLGGAEWKRTGLLYAFATAKGAQGFSETAHILEEHFGVRSQWIDRSDLPAFDSALRTDLEGAFHFPDDASLSPEGLASSWAAKLKNAGVSFLENTLVERIVRAGDQVASIETSNGSLPADHYVLAAGALSGRIARDIGARIPVEPGKGYSVTMARPAVSPAIPMLFPEHHVGISPFEKSLRIGSMMEFVGFDSTISARRTAQLRASASRYLTSELPSTNIEQWYGWRPMTWDSLPIIGPIPGFENLCAATGHNMLGMSLAPATGKLVAEMIAAQLPHIDPAPYSAARF